MKIALNLSHAFLNKDLKPGYTALAFGDSFYPCEKELAGIVQQLLTGGSITACRFKGNTRKNDTYVSGQLIAVDLESDNGDVSVMQAYALPFVREFAFLVYPSASSKVVTDKNPNAYYRSRAFFVLSEPITDRETYRSYARAIMQHLGLPADEASIKPAQPWYGSTNRAEQPQINLDAVLPLQTVKAIAAPMIA